MSTEEGKAAAVTDSSLADEFAAAAAIPRRAVTASQGSVGSSDFVKVETPTASEPQTLGPQTQAAEAPTASSAATVSQAADPVFGDGVKDAWNPNGCLVRRC